MTHYWQKTECFIISADVEKNSGEYYLNVKYEYDFSGTEYISEVYEKDYGGSSSYDKTALLLEKYKPGETSVCYVNPKIPSQAVLNHKTPWIVFLIFIPLIFVFIGAGMIYSTWFYKENNEKTAPISKKPEKSDGTLLGVALFGVFFIIGAGVFYFIFFKAFVNFIDARNWIETPCTVISSSIREHDSDDGITYSVDILYSYEVEGKEYKSNSYGFINTSSSDYGGKKNIINKYPAGKEAFCYVSPEYPELSVISRDFPLMMLFGLIPLAFILVGLGGMVSCLFGKEDEIKDFSDVRYEANVTLKSKKSPLKTFISSIIFCALWNGFLYGIITLVYKDTTNPLSCTGAIFLILILIGLSSIVGVFQNFLALFNPRPVLTLSSIPLPLGGNANIKWEFWGNTYMIQKFHMYLEGREEATYERGTDTCTDRETFLTINLFETADPEQMYSGRADFEIPPDTMHSFKSKNNKIIWTLHIIGKIKWWSDIKEEFEITVLPDEFLKGGIL